MRIVCRRRFLVPSFFTDNPPPPHAHIDPLLPPTPLEAFLFSGTAAKFDVVPATTMHRKFRELLVRIPVSVLFFHGTTRQSAVFLSVRPVFQLLLD